MSDTNLTNLRHFILSNLDTCPLENALEKADSVGVFCPEGIIPFLTEKLREGYHVFFPAKDEISAESVYETLKAFNVDNVFFFPDVDVIPFTNVFPSMDKLSDRINTLYQMTHLESPCIVVTTAESFIRKIPPVESLRASAISLKPGDIIEIDAFTRHVVSMGYVREFKVIDQGGFSVRGDIIDIFPPHLPDAVRINLFGDEIESIKYFNPVTQISTDEIPRIDIIPANEFLCASPTEENSEIMNEPSAHSKFPELYDKLSCLSDYAEGKKIVVFPHDTETSVEIVFSQYDNYSPNELSADYLLNHLDDIHIDKRVYLKNFISEDSLQLNVSPPPQFSDGFSAFVGHIPQLLETESERLFLFVEYEDLATRLMKILENYQPAMIKMNESTDLKSKLNIVVGSMEKGFFLKSDENNLFLSETDISGKKRLFRKRVRQIDSLFEDIDDIQVGESVVHLNYGIGIFRGIQRITVLGTAKDYILIEYDDGEKLFVPLEQANLIGKYVGGSGKKPKLDSLGSKSWAKKRNNVQKSIEEFANKLVAIYAKREALQGHNFGIDTVWQKEFEDQFEYIETPDQMRVIEEIKGDMEIVRPMDRLLCGDVGFGKTEVAMRAAFKSVMNGKQVAVIAPTTVLVEQHYYTFQERFKGFPVKIEYVSRFTPTKKLYEIIRDLSEHKIDILIGTHKLFSKKLVFKSLGMVIIDEEHKFGVEHKETLKERYPLVDFLSLSATPIPRTLHLSLSTIRDISLLQTPPDMRIPIQTFVSDFTSEVVKHALEQELDRGGQVFFVHNTIKRLQEYAFFIEQLIPKAKVCIGHGQMHEEELEESFIGFVKGHYNVFVCTTIIESGLDIPNANTIIISDAHRFGLSQLYQLKGRVGRSKREGYAYFLYPKDKALTETAQKRLYVINEYTDLGSGFQIAMQDMEIRGAGNILGREQHGNIIAVGYDVYMRLLKEEVQRLRGENIEEADTMIDLKYNAYIPDEFITDTATRMEIYKKIVSVRSEDEIRLLTHEMTDRFGKIPEEVSTLFQISRLKIKSGKMGIQSLIEKNKNIEITFSKYSRVDPGKVLKINANRKHPISINPYKKNMLFYEQFDSNITIKVKTMIAFLNEIEESP